MKNLLIAVGLGVSLVGAVTDGHSAEVAGGELSANIGVASNYLFRGVTQTDDGAAVFGGVDWVHESGFYTGAWLSNVDFGDPDEDDDDVDSPSAEFDAYAGYAFVLGEFDLDVNTIYYWYPDADDDFDYWEIGGSAGWQWLTAGLQYTVWGEVNDGPFNNGDIYYYANAAFEPIETWGLGFAIGQYDFDEGDDYTHWGVSLSKDTEDFGTFSLNYEQTDDDEGVAVDDDPKLWVGWSISFE